MNNEYRRNKYLTSFYNVHVQFMDEPIQIEKLNLILCIF